MRSVDGTGRVAANEGGEGLPILIFLEVVVFMLVGTRHLDAGLGITCN